MTTANKTMMTTVRATVVDSKGVLISLLANADNDVLETKQAPGKFAAATGANVAMLIIADGFAVCDKTMEGSYYTYLCDTEEEATACYRAIADADDMCKGEEE